MEIPFFLAMTPCEQTKSPFPRHMAHMSCHFSGEGLTHIPNALPPGSILILDDAIPMSRQEIPQVVSQLSNAARRLCCHSVLLDFQRPGEPRYAQLAHALLQALPCPMGISEAYAESLNCPVFLSPPPPGKPPKDIAAPWIGRELWLDAACTATELTVTGSGCRESIPQHLPEVFPHQDTRLCCHYHTAIEETGIRFTLHRSPQDLLSLIHALTPFGLTRAIGLYQEFGQSFTP